MMDSEDLVASFSMIGAVSFLFFNFMLPFWGTKLDKTAFKNLIHTKQKSFRGFNPQGSQNAFKHFARAASSEPEGAKPHQVVLITPALGTKSNSDIIILNNWRFKSLSVGLGAPGPGLRQSVCIKIPAVAAADPDRAFKRIVKLFIEGSGNVFFGC